MRRIFIALIGLFAASHAAAAQTTPLARDSTAARLPRWRVGFAADIGQPVGDFKHQVRNAAGGQGYALLRLDRAALVSLRLQGGWLNYGSERQRTCLGSPPYCRVAVDLTTANGILSLALGPQLSLPIGRTRMYGYGLVGMSRFATLSGLGGGLLPDFIAADENFGDTGLLLTGGTGLEIPVHRKAAIDIGIGYERHGTRDYLVKGGLTDKPDGTLGMDIKRSNAELLAIRVGLTMTPGRRNKQVKP